MGSNITILNGDLTKCFGGQTQVNNMLQFFPYLYEELITTIHLEFKLQVFLPCPVLVVYTYDVILRANTPFNHTADIG